MKLHPHLMGPWKSLAKLKSAHEARGGHWLTPEAMKFFETKIHGKLIANRYFVTSEAHRSISTGATSRRFTVRQGNDDATISNYSEKDFSSSAQARRWLRTKLDQRQRKLKSVPANPVESGYSRSVISDNIRELMAAGRTQAQSVAIALRSARASYRREHPVGGFPRHLKRRS